MGGLFSAKFLVVLAVVMVVLGPEKLPETARNMGRWLEQLRSVSTGFRQEMHKALSDSDLAEPVQELRNAGMTLRGAATDWRVAAVGWMATAPGGQGAPSTTGGPPAPLSVTDSGGWVRPEGELGIPPGDPSLN